MENLEKEIISRLNKVLIKYNLEIISKINHKYKTTISLDDTFKRFCYEYNLVEVKDNTIIECYYTWDTIKSILIESMDIFSLFNIIKRSHNALNNYIESGVEPPVVHLIIDKLYNELAFLSNCNSYEELIIKMNLIGI
jgi:hypothetical protein